VTLRFCFSANYYISYLTLNKKIIKMGPDALDMFEKRCEYKSLTKVPTNFSVTISVDRHSGNE